MTTFTTEDRIISEAIPEPTPEPTWEERWGKEWVDAVRKGWNIQNPIVWFWPLTEQLPLDLDYGPTHLHFRAKGIAGVHSMPIKGTVHEFTTVATITGNITPQAQLTVTPNNSVGDLSIGNIRVGLEKKPTWLQRKLHKLLGFNWKDRDSK